MLHLLDWKCIEIDLVTCRLRFNEKNSETECDITTLNICHCDENWTPSHSVMRNPFAATGPSQYITSRRVTPEVATSTLSFEFL